MLVLCIKSMYLIRNTVLSVLEFLQNVFLHLKSLNILVYTQWSRSLLSGQLF